MGAMRFLTAAGLLLLATSCGARKAVMYPAAESDLLAKEVLEWHEDRFLLDHNEKLAEAWSQYRRARARLVELWKRHQRTLHADTEEAEAARKEIESAKAEFLQCARRLREHSQQMASEAQALLEAALKIPPVIEDGAGGSR